MEIFELQYFLSVAKNENIHRASEESNVSPGSLSKAISRLEDELGVSLFYKQGRNIRLTPEGIALKKRASQIVQLTEDTKVEIGGTKGTLNIVISAEEILQTKFGLELSQVIQKNYPNARFQFQIQPESKVLQQVQEGEVHFGIITGEAPNTLSSKVLTKVEFKTCVSRKHPLLKKYSQSAKIPVEDVLKHSFVSPDQALLGRVTTSASLDGWRDDKFPRSIQYRASGLKVMEELIGQGHAIAYLPDYFVQSLDLIPLNITGCPYSCHQTVRLICKEPKSLGWMDKVWDHF